MPAVTDTPTLPLTLEQWRANPVSGALLRELLAQPVLQQAVACLLNESHPTSSHLGLKKLKLRHAWLAGYGDFFRDLQKLAKALPVAPPMDEWAHVQAPTDPHED